MVIEEISREGVLKASRESLGLSAVAGDLVDDPMLVALLRRAAGILCPCAPSTIISSVLEGLQYLVEDKNSTEGRLANLADRLIISGDLLELNQVTTDDPSVRATWVFAAPPSFVERPDGSIFLLGIVPDEVTPLPASLAGRVIHEGLVRVLTPELSEDLDPFFGALDGLSSPRPHGSRLRSQNHPRKCERRCCAG